MEKPGRKIALDEVALVGRLGQAALGEPVRTASRSRPRAVVGDDDLDLRPRSAAETRTRAASGLPAARRTVGRLDAVVDGVAHQVRERVLQPFEDRAVDLDVAPLDDQVDVLAPGRRDVAPVRSSPWQASAKGSIRTRRTSSSSRPAARAELAAVGVERRGEPLQLLLDDG